MRVLWLKDRKSGHLNKARGLLRALSDLTEYQVIEYEINWSMPGIRQVLTKMGDIGLNLPICWFLKGLPNMDGVDLIISAGGATQWANAAIAKQRCVPNVFLGSLRSMNINAFSLAASHDAPLDTERFFRYDIIPSQFTPESFSDEAKSFNDTNKQIWGLMIGGDGEGYLWSKDDYFKLCEEFLSQAIDAGVCIWVATSRRTPKEIEAYITSKVEASGLSLANSYCHTKDESTRPLGLMMAVCSTICVTADSMSMTHEAVSTGTPVVVISLETGGNDRLKGNLNRLEQEGLVVLQTLGFIKISDVEPAVGWNLMSEDSSKPLAVSVLKLYESGVK
jgi:mitochondrial fission protein ELM1